MYIYTYIHICKNISVIKIKVVKFGQANSTNAKGIKANGIKFINRVTDGAC